MQDQPYPDNRPAIQRELDRIAAVLEITGVDVTGTNISIADEMADIRWEAGDGSRWMAVVSRFDPALWTELAEGSQPPAGQS
jgi:hypothetical protein